jgi:hypothetical protein
MLKQKGPLATCLCAGPVNFRIAVMTYLDQVTALSLSRDNYYTERPRNIATSFSTATSRLEYLLRISPVMAEDQER